MATQANVSCVYAGVVQNALSLPTASVYAAPTSPATTIIIKSINVGNSSGASQLLSFWIVPSGSSPSISNQMGNSITVVSNNPTAFNEVYILNAGDGIAFYCPVANALNVRINALAES